MKISNIEKRREYLRKAQRKLRDEQRALGKKPNTYWIYPEVSEKIKNYILYLNTLCEKRDAK